MPRFKATITFEYECDDPSIYGISPNHPNKIAAMAAIDKQSFEQFDLLMMVMESKEYKVTVEET